MVCIIKLGNIVEGLIEVVTFGRGKDIATWVAKKLDAPILSETSAVNLGVYAARKDADAVVLAEQIDFSALNLGVLQTDFLETELNDQVTVKRETYDNRVITINGVIEGMAHSITPEDWRVSYFTSVLDPYSITI